MKDFEQISTDELWKGIEEYAKAGQKRVNWVEYLDTIKILVALIDERVEVFQRRMRVEQLLGEHRLANRLEKIKGEQRQVAG